MLFKVINVLIFLWYLIIIVESYSQVKISGKNISIDNQNDGPVVHKSLNMDLIFPKIFNRTESTTTRLSDEVTSSESTGRAVYSSKQFQFPVSNNRKTSNSGYNNNRNLKSSSPNYVYPVYRPQSRPSLAEINKIRGQGQAMDRYAPGEAVASALFKIKKNALLNKKNGNLRPAASSQVISKQSYVPVEQKDLYSFPPNHSKYPPPNQVSSTNQISSYVPPAAGPADATVVTDYVGPVSPEYLPPNLINKMPSDDVNMPQTDMDSEINSAMDNGKNNGHDGDLDDMTYPTPPPGYLDESPPDDNMMPMPMPMTPMTSDSSNDNSPDYNQDHLPDYLHDHGSPPQNSHMHKPDDHSLYNSHDHIPDNFHHDHSSYHSSSPWKSFPSFYGSHGIDDYPEVNYDDHHHHHHHQHTTLPPPLPPLPTTTEEPPEPRVKKYSYFYLGRKLWYIPLYFTVWFSFYVLWLIIKSIARHKVNLPNHYQTRSLMKRSIWTPNLSHKEASEEIDELTISVMEKIDSFKHKYL